MTRAAHQPNANVTTPSDREIRIERIFNAPRDRVWKALTDPALVAQWWGRGNKLVIERMEVHRGGHWRFVEHSPDGVHGFEGRYREVTPPERVVQTFAWDGMPGHVAVETMTLEDLGDGRTKVVTVSLFHTTEERDGMLHSGMEQGLNQSYAALDGVLAGLGRSDELASPSDGSRAAVPTRKIAPCLWFDTEAEQAAKLYVSIFKNSGIDAISRYGKEGFEFHGRPEGAVMTVAFRLDGQEFTALNGGPQFKFNEAVSLQVFCDTQDEVDHFWNKLSDGGEEGPCGWLKDRFGLSWQIVPSALPGMLRDPDTEKSQRVTKAFLQMKKFDIAALQRAYEGA